MKNIKACVSASWCVCGEGFFFSLLSFDVNVTESVCFLSKYGITFKLFYSKKAADAVFSSAVVLRWSDSRGCCRLDYVYVQTKVPCTLTIFSIYINLIQQTSLASSVRGRGLQQVV